MKMQNWLQNMALHMRQDQWKPKIPGLPLGLELKLSLAAALWLKRGLPLQLGPGGGGSVVGRVMGWLETGF